MRVGNLRLFVLSALRRFAAAQDGVVAVVLALSLLPVLTLAGAAIDLRRVSAARTNLQTTADAAALAGADAVRRTDVSSDTNEIATKAKLDENAKKAATAFVTAAFADAGRQPTIDVTRAGTAVTVKLGLLVPMTIMKMVRSDDTSITADATATYGPGGSDPGTDVPSAELVLALDTTESMAADGRMSAAKDAAKSFIDQLSLATPNLRVGLVPFAKYVNIGTRYQGAAWLNGPDWLRTSLSQQRCPDECVEYDLQNVDIDRTCYLNDKDPYPCPIHIQTWTNCRRWKPGNVCFTTTWYGCVGSEQGRDESDVSTSVPAITIEDANSWFQYDMRCPEALLRLTTNHAWVKQRIDRLTPEGETYIAPGLLWGWRLLSPRSVFADGSAIDGVKKYLLLMTDGVNTHSPYDGYDYHVHEGTDNRFANDKLQKICANVKAAGIRVLTIAFRITDSPTKELLKSCAYTPSDYYDAPSNSELQRAFQAIGARMTALRLIR